MSDLYSLIGGRWMTDAPRLEIETETGLSGASPVGGVAARARRTLLVVAGLLLATAVAAEVERIEVEIRQPVAGGKVFGLSGPYEKVAGRVYFSLDPAAAGNSRVVDLDKASVRADGRVEYSAEFHLLRPMEAKKGNGTLLLEVPNRGGKALVRYFNRRAAGTLDPVEAEHFGDGFLLRRGFTLAWLGWQWDVPERPGLLRLYPAFAAHDVGEGLVRSDHVFSRREKVLPLAHRNHRGYPVSSPDDPRNVLSVRDSRNGPRRVIPRSSWRFARVSGDRVVDDPSFLYLESGFEPGKIYEAVYVAEGPAIVGLGLAAMRDFVSYLKHDPESPVAVERGIGLGISQTGRFLRHFLYQGFNADLEGRRAFDGLMIHTAGAGRGSFNHRFAQPSRDAHRFSAFWYPTDIYPFSGRAQKDPETGRQEGLLDTTRAADVAPQIFFTNTGYEYWGRAASLLHTSLDGTADVALAPHVRIYHLSSAQHFVGGFPPRSRGSAWETNPANFLFVLRALLVAMNRWVGSGIEPPPSRYPMVADGTLVAREELSFPAIPGLGPVPEPHSAHRVQYGPRFASHGIVDLQPPRVGKAFGVRVPASDADGNERGGLRLPEIAVPVATYTPWNLRAPDTGSAHEMADFVGAFVPFPNTLVERRRTADPRRSLDERYPTRFDYLGRYTEAAIELVEEHYLLAEDLPEMIEHASELWSLVRGDTRGESTLRRSP